MLWFTSPQSDWCQLEASSCFSSSLQALACSTLPFSPSQFTSNPIVTGTLKIWAQIRRHFNWLTLPQSTPICDNHLFLPSKIDPQFTYLDGRGLRRLDDLYIDNQFASFDQLRIALELRASDFFRYLQMRSFAKTHSAQFPSAPPPTGVDLLLRAESLPRGHVTYFYHLLCPGDESAINKIKASWEGELQTDLSEDFWTEALSAVNSSSSCARLSLIQFKVLHRLHYSKAKLSRIYPDKINDRCDRCLQAPCNLTHMFWLCPKLSNFWQSIFNTISEIIGQEIQLSPHIAIFGTPDEDCSLTNAQLNVVAFSSLIARRRILLLWKSSSPPSYKGWLRDILSFLKLEKIKFTLRGSSERFYSHWRPLITYVDQLPPALASPE